MGLFARKIFGKVPCKVSFKLYNSFAKTGPGHGTDRAILGGILGFDVSDSKIKESYYYAEKQNLKYSFEYLSMDYRHPNSADIIFYDEKDNELMKISANSLGGGEVQVNKIDDFSTDIRGDYPVLILVYKDQKGVLSKVSNFIQDQGINIASLSCERRQKHKEAVMTICLDSVLPDETIETIRELPDMYLVRNIERLEE